MSRLQKSDSTFARALNILSLSERRKLIAITFVQVLLGVLTVLSSTSIVPGVWAKFEWFAQLHQLVGMLLLLSVVNILFATKEV